jgi:hypothetical protein
VGEGAVVDGSVLGEGSSVPAGMHLTEVRVAAGDEATSP